MEEKKLYYITPIGENAKYEDVRFVKLTEREFIAISWFNREFDTDFEIQEFFEDEVKEVF